MESKRSVGGMRAFAALCAFSAVLLQGCSVESGPDKVQTVIEDRAPVVQERFAEPQPAPPEENSNGMTSITLSDGSVIRMTGTGNIRIDNDGTTTVVTSNGGTIVMNGSYSSDDYDDEEEDDCECEDEPAPPPKQVKPKAPVKKVEPVKPVAKPVIPPVAKTDSKDEYEKPDGAECVDGVCYPKGAGEHAQSPSEEPKVQAEAPKVEKKGLLPISTKDFTAKISERDGVTLVMFGATWCPACKALLPVLTNMGVKGASVMTLDAERSPDVYRKYAKAHAYPETIAFYDGKPIPGMTVVGYPGAAEMQSFLAKAKRKASTIETATSASVEEPTARTPKL